MLNIKETLAAFKNQKILIIGDAMLDCYLNGNVERISPEAPVPIISLYNKIYRLGGAANVALNVKELGGQPFLFSVIGRDSAGKRLLDILPQNKISAKYLLISDNRRTTIKSRILAQNQQMLRFDEEDVFDLRENEQVEFLNTIEQFLKDTKIDTILFQDYNKGVLTPKVIRKILLIASKKSIPTVVDPKQKHFYTYKNVTLFKPNLKEINDNLPFQSAATLPDLKAANAYVNQQINNSFTLITLSNKGIFYSDGKEENILPTTPRNIADVCGAGDAVISIAALGIAMGLPINEIAKLSNLAGGQVCEKVGVAPILAQELQKEYIDYIKNSN